MLLARASIYAETTAAVTPCVSPLKIIFRPISRKAATALFARAVDIGYADTPSTFPWRATRTCEALP